jgi:short-subunit dehydrogenase
MGVNILLTGASNGIGYETALAFSNYNVDNLILISRNKTKLQQLKSVFENKNGQTKITLISEDIVKIMQNPSLLLNKIALERLDILINNAGYLSKNSFLEIKTDEINKMLTVNTVAPVFLVRILHDFLLKSVRSHVVNIGSIGGFQGSKKFSGLSFYSASKAALACLTECMAEELSGTSIKTNCLALGAVNTEMLGKAFPGYNAPVNPKQMGRFIADFAMNGHNFFNGKILPVSLSTP